VKSLIYALVAIVVIAALGACNPTLSVESPQPPGRSARVDAVDGFWGLQYYRMEISTGVAIALTCNRGGPCEHMKVVSDDPAIAEVRLASLATLKQRPYGEQTQQTEAALVVVGKAAGKTKLHVTAEEGHRDVVVTVIPAPQPAVTATAAK